MKAIEPNIYTHDSGGFVVKKYNQYCGYYKNLEDARKVRNSIKPKPKRIRYKVTIQGLSDRLQESIGVSGKDIAQISRETSIVTSNIYEYIRGNSVPSSVNLAKLATCLNVSTDWLLGLSKRKERV